MRLCPKEVIRTIVRQQQLLQSRQLSVLIFNIRLVSFSLLARSASRLDTLLGVVSKQLRLLHGRVEDFTTSVNFLSPQMSELVEDAIAS